VFRFKQDAWSGIKRRVAQLTEEMSAIDVLTFYVCVEIRKFEFESSGSRSNHYVAYGWPCALTKIATDPKLNVMRSHFAGLCVWQLVSQSDSSWLVSQLVCQFVCQLVGWLVLLLDTTVSNVLVGSRPRPRQRAPVRTASEPNAMNGGCHTDLSF
jgi:hypothetical protein